MDTSTGTARRLLRYAGEPFRMNFREYTSTETSAFIERITAAAEAASQNAVQEARSTADAEIERLRADADALRKQVESLVAESAQLRTQADADAAKAQRQEVTTLLVESIDAFDALAAASTLDELFTNLVQQVAVQFPRVVIFRRKGQRLEGELATGLDGAVDLADLAITMSAASIVTTAAAQGVYEFATAEQLVNSHTLPGDVPAFAVAAPVVFQGETLAVLYADTDQQDKGEAHAAFAGVLAAHTNVLLSRLTQELKIARELREYAQMLLHEAGEMFIADTKEGRSEPDRLRRLRDTIDFGRQLYAQRAALEGPGAAGLLEEEITALVDADPATEFSGALAAALEDLPVEARSA